MALVAVGVDERHLHQNKVSGAHDDRSSLKGCLVKLRSNDVLVFWKLDRLGRFLPSITGTRACALALDAAETRGHPAA